MRELVKKQITFQQLQYKQEGLSNHILSLNCENCSTHYEVLVKKFLRRKYKEPLCPDCYKNLKMYDEEWREKNRQSQLITQNKSEIIEKQRQSQLKRHREGGEELRQKYQQIGKKLWSNPEYRTRQHEVLLNNWKNPEYRNKIFSNYKQYIGEYKGNRYYSLVEFSFLLYCEESNIQVKNYDLEGISYQYEGKEKHYYPDYIINNDTIIEVKGKGRWYEKHRQQIEAKNIALTKYCEQVRMKNRLVFDSDLGTAIWKKAKNIHNAQISQENF